jgi:uncharacterized protein DUF732
MTVKRMLPEIHSGRRKALLHAMPGLATQPRAPLPERVHAMPRRRSVVAGIAVASALAAVAHTLAPPAFAVPAPDVEYTYDVVARRHYDFPNNDAIGYGYGICDKVRNGEGYPQVMAEVKSDVLPNDEFAANYLVSYAVGILCPPQIWQLRNSAANYTPPPGS